MIRVLIVAAYASVRAGLHALLADAEDVAIVGFDDMTHLAQRIQGNVAFTAATIVGYLGFIFLINMVMRVYLLRDAKDLQNCMAGPTC